MWALPKGKIKKKIIKKGRGCSWSRWLPGCNECSCSQTHLLPSRAAHAAGCGEQPEPWAGCSAAVLVPKRWWGLWRHNVPSCVPAWCYQVPYSADPYLLAIPAVSRHPLKGWRQQHLSDLTASAPKLLGKVSGATGAAGARPCTTCSMQTTWTVVRESEQAQGNKGLQLTQKEQWEESSQR